MEKKKIISKNPDDWLGYSQLQDAFESSEIISKYPKAHVIVRSLQFRLFMGK